jgi:putative serine protease PepD
MLKSHRSALHRTGLTAIALAGVTAIAGCGQGGSGTGLSSGVNPVSAIVSPLAGQQQQFVQVVKAVSPQVVQIQGKRALGSGVVFDAQGDVVTNAHVIRGERQLVVTLSGGDEHPATIVGSDPSHDLAVVHLTGATPAPATFADSSPPQVGDLVLAIGNPLGLRSSVTQGIVSSLNRAVGEGNGVTLSPVIQTSAAINPGNSGGALVDMTGQVIGIPTLAALDPELGGAQAPGIGFAIPSNVAKRIADQLIANGRVVRSGRAYLGVRVATIVGGGVLVASVAPGGPAAKAGIKQGDVIVEVDGKPTPTADVLVSVLASLHPSQQVTVKLLRHGKEITVRVTLGELRG